MLKEGSWLSKKEIVLSEVLWLKLEVLRVEKAHAK
jgi:hypothetical protein